MAGLSLDDLSGGSSAWSPETVGDRISGTIISIERRQQADFTSGEPLTWSDGSPRLQTVIELQTDERGGDDDDGKRRVYLKGGRNYEAAEGKGQSGEVALANAAKEAGLSSIDEGAKLTIIHSGLAKATQRGWQPAKLYVAKLEAVKASVSIDDFD